jgi:hypothetical protein
MIGRLYRALVWLHPSAFRLRFADEMLWIFAEAETAWGAAALLGDAALSLLRQWLIRTALWKWALATIAALIPLIISFGSFLPWDRPVHP